MLTHILIRDFAIIDTLELELKPGMTVLTGETGAGNPSWWTRSAWSWATGPTRTWCATAASGPR